MLGVSEGLKSMAKLMAQQGEEYIHDMAFCEDIRLNL